MSAEWEELNQKTIELLMAGDFDGARASAEKSVSMAREGGDRENLAVGLNNLGAVFTSAGDFAAAETALEEARQVCAARATWTARGTRCGRL